MQHEILFEVPFFLNYIIYCNTIFKHCKAINYSHPFETLCERHNVQCAPKEIKSKNITGTINLNH